MIHSLNPYQDENSQPYLSSKRQGNDGTKRFAGFAGSTPLGKHTGPLSARKALGNITNKAASSQQTDVTPFKGTPSAFGSRKALGDITNATPADMRSKTVLQKLTQKGSAAKPRLAKKKTQAEIYAEDGIEKLAGKSMQQLESDREQRDIMEAKQKAAYIASLPSVFPVLQRGADVLSDLTTLEQEVLEAPPSPRMMPQCTDDLLELLESPSSMIAEIASGDLEMLSDIDDDDEQQDQHVFSDKT